MGNDIIMDASVIAESMNTPAPLDFSVWGLFLKADYVVKSVIIVLVFASFWSWSVIIDKWFIMRRLRLKTDRFENVFWSGKSLEDLYYSVGSPADHPMAEVFRLAMTEWRQTNKLVGGFTPSAQERVDKVMSNTISKELTRLERYMNFLATVGSVAPFVGLFGTVWGIMKSFQAIAASRDTSLAVVAPGIAEALFATALGLLAAIPAVMAYNKFNADINRFGVRLEAFADDFSGVLSRQNDQ